MPHFIVECTENIREEARLPELFASVNTALAATGIFPLGGLPARHTTTRSPAASMRTMRFW